MIFEKSFKNSDRSKNREIFYRYCDSSKFQKIISWKPKVSLEMGIRKIIKHLNENQR